MSCCSEYFQTIAVYVFGIQLVFGVFRWLYGNVVGPWLLEPVNVRKYGKWALVTGATDGIGKQFAISLAKRGCNIILVSRTLSKLEDVAKQISSAYNVQTKVIAVNFTAGAEIYEQIKQQIVGMEIGILINNVGMFYQVPEMFLNIPDREKLIQDIIKCNITAVPMMCNLILPQMVERQKGLIVNVSSMASIMPGPSMIIYSASKAFVNKFSDDLGAEYKDQGIDVQVLLTGGVCTKMNKIQADKFTTPSATTYVESALRYVGYSHHTTGYYGHSILQIVLLAMNFIAPSLTQKLVKKQMLTIRDKEIKEGIYTSAK